LGTILDTPLYEVRDPNNAADLCSGSWHCGYEFTFTMAGLAPGDTNEIQLQATALVSEPGIDVPEVLSFDLFAGIPPSVGPEPLSSPTHVATSGLAGTGIEVIKTRLGDGSYYVQVAPSQVAVSGEIGSGAFDANVPEPMAWALMLMGLGGLGAAMRSRRGLQPRTV
jgi:hypothetical protein